MLIKGEGYPPVVDQGRRLPTVRVPGRVTHREGTRRVTHREGTREDYPPLREAVTMRVVTTR